MTLERNCQTGLDRLGLERDWRRVGAPVPTCAGQGKPELTEARRAEGIPEGPSRPSVEDGSIRSLGAAKGQVDQEHYHQCIQQLDTFPWITLT